jgi:hypothetical protein
MGRDGDLSLGNPGPSESEAPGATGEKAPKGRFVAQTHVNANKPDPSQARA